MVATDNIELEKRIVFHGKCPTCGNNDFDSPDIYDENGRFMADVMCYKCLDTKGAEPFHDVEISNFAKLEIIATPTKRQQLYFHVYQVSTVEDGLNNPVEATN